MALVLARQQKHPCGTAAGVFILLNFHLPQSKNATDAIALNRFCVHVLEDMGGGRVVRWPTRKENTPAGIGRRVQR